MVTLVNRAKMSTSTTGTGTITLGSAETGYQTFADAGVADGNVVRYVIEDGNDWEIGSGTYTSSGTTLSRTVDESSNADAALNLTGSAVVFITAAAEDIPSLELYAENPSSPTAPSATGTNAVAIGDQSVSAGTRSIALGDSYVSGTDSLAAVIADNTSTYGATGTNSVAIGYLSKATNNYSFSLGFGPTASGVGAVAAGYTATSTGSYSVALGRSRSTGNDSFSAAIASTSASYGSSGSNAVALGTNAKASALGSFAAGGTDAQATGTRSIAIGGYFPVASGDYAIALGWAGVPQDRKMGYSQLRFTTSGDAQLGTVVLAAATTDATPTVLSFDNFTSSNIVILPNNSAYAFHGTIVARQQASGGTASAAWKIEGLIRREGSAGTTVLVNSATTVLDNTPSWGMALSADTTNGGLKIEVTGAASTNIRWVATIHTSEVTYA